LPGAAGVPAQRVASGLAVQVAGVGFDQVVHDDRVHGGLLKGGKKWVVSAMVPPNGAAGSRPGPAREAQGLYEPLVAAEAAESDIIAVPHADGAVVLSHPGGGCLWLPVPGDDYQALREYLDPALRQARSNPVIELFRAAGW
jgi:hypothetical protein